MGESPQLHLFTLAPLFWIRRFSKNNLLGEYRLIEKGTPHCKLLVVKALVAAGKARSTYTALAGGAALGFNFAGIVAIVKVLRPSEFHKSMTTHGDHRIWQDIYRPETTAGKVYLKLTVIDDVLIVSFKEL